MEKLGSREGEKRGCWLPERPRGVGPPHNAPNWPVDADGVNELVYNAAIQIYFITR